MLGAGKGDCGRDGNEQMMKMVVMADGQRTLESLEMLSNAQHVKGRRNRSQVLTRYILMQAFTDNEDLMYILHPILVLNTIRSDCLVRLNNCRTQPAQSSSSLSFASSTFV